MDNGYESNYTRRYTDIIHYIYIIVDITAVLCVAGTGGRPVCTEMGCRARLARQLAGSAAAAATISTVLSVVAAAILVTAL